MLRSYLNITFRNLKKNKLISFINIAGLTIGITFFLLLFSYVWDEYTYDRFHEKKDNIYTLYRQAGSISMIELYPEQDKQLEILIKQFPEIVSYTRAQQVLLSVGYDRKKNKENVHCVDPSFLNIFTFPLKYGNSENALNQPNSIVISEEIAQRYFGSQMSVGKMLNIHLGDKTEAFRVTGVLREYPGNSSIKPSLLIPFENLNKVYTSGSDLRLRRAIFYEMKDNVNIPELENKITNKVFESKKKLNKYCFTKFVNTHFESVSFSTPVIVNRGKAIYSYILGALAVGILLLACFNYMNLSIGSFSTRFREIGIRKVAGAEKGGIRIQFICEAAAVTFVSFLICLILTRMLLPVMNQLSGKTIDFGYLISWESISVIILLLMGTTLATGSYPALILSKVNAVDIFKGKTMFGGKKNVTRFLLVFQFGLAALLVTGTLLISKQIKFIQSKDLGYDPKNVVIVSTFCDLRANAEVDGGKIVESIKESLSNYPRIESIAGVFSENAGLLQDDGISYYPYLRGSEEINVMRMEEDINYLSTIKATILQGRGLSDKYPADKENSAVVNEAFLKAFKIKNPIGKNLSEIASINNKRMTDRENFNPIIVGVVKDFNTGSLYRKIMPVIISYGAGWMYTHMAIRITPGSIQNDIGLLKQAWQKTGLAYPFTYRFLDEVISDEYIKEKRWNEIFGYSSFFAIVVAGMGLLGMSSLTIARRTKEIGIRKVLGAEIKGLLLLLTKEFVLLVLIAGTVTWPLAYYLGSKWLEDFAYHTSLTADVLLLPLVVTLLVALTAVSYYTIRAALANPVESLKNE